jgi:phage terminase large subunit-like protein
VGAAEDLSWIDSLPEEARHALLHEVTHELNKDNLADYRPYAKQREFHALGLAMRERLLRAGNQNGKTFCVGNETAYHLTGEYPDWWEGRRFSRPVVVWASGETGESTRDNAQRVLLGHPGEEGTGAIPARCLSGDYGMASGVAHLYDYIKVRHASGGLSLLKFKYYAQRRRKWQGPPVDFVWYDEEPPEDIYDEGLARTIATGGFVALSFTPLLGMSEVVGRFLLTPTPDRSDTNMTIEDAEHIPPEERARIINSFPAHEREARAQGIPTMGSGLIFPVTEQSILVDPFPIPKHWPRIIGLDFGWDHPTAATAHAWDRDSDCWYVTNEFRESEATPALVAPAIKAWGSWIPVAWPHDGLQHDKGSGIALAHQYRDNGLMMLKEHATHEDGGNGVEAGLMDMLEAMQTGRFKVFSNLPGFLEERRLYHRKNGKVIKLKDDILSSARYARMMRRFAKTRPVPQQAVVPAFEAYDSGMGY